MSTLWAELKRRKVFRVAVVYAATAFVLLQAADLLAGGLSLPGWFVPAFTVLLILGFPVAIVLAWALELTPDGIRRSTPAAAGEELPALLGKRTVFIASVFVALGIGLGAGWFLKPGTGVPGDAARERAELPAGEGVDPSEAIRDLSIAVLPFSNVSPDPGQAYFADGITDAIISALVRVEGVSVAARTSVFAFKDRLEDVRQVGGQLGVSHVLEGSVRAHGTALRITAQLISVETGFHLWSQTFDRQLSDIFAIQDEIANAIAANLATTVIGRVDAVPQRTADLDAYDLFLRGRSQLRQRELEGAWQSLHEATRLDPGFAPAWASLAISYQSVARNEEAEAAARAALALDPENVDALNALAGVFRDRNRWFEAEDLFRRTLALDPDSSELLEDYAEFLGVAAQFEAMLEISSRGFRLDPLLAPLRDIHIAALIFHGRLEEALDLAMDPDTNLLWSGPRRVQILLLRNQVELAIREIERYGRHAQTDVSGVIALLRDPSDAAARQQVIDRFLASAPGGIQGRLTFVVLGHVGDHALLLENFIDRDPQLQNAGEWYWMPELEPARASPDFARLVALLGLPAYWDERGWPVFCRPDGRGGAECQQSADRNHMLAK